MSQDPSKAVNGKLVGSKDIFQQLANAFPKVNVEGNAGITTDVFDYAKSMNALFRDMNYRKFLKWVSNQRASSKRQATNYNSKPVAS